MHTGTAEERKSETQANLHAVWDAVAATAAAAFIYIMKKTRINFESIEHQTDTHANNLRRK